EAQLAQAVSDHLITTGAQIFQSPTATLIERGMPQLMSISGAERLELIKRCQISQGQLELEISAKSLADRLSVQESDLAASSLSFTSP
ncbi:hypothetical protein RSW15_24425, partial [Escherichia coli]